MRHAADCGTVRQKLADFKATRQRDPTRVGGDVVARAGSPKRDVVDVVAEFLGACSGELDRLARGGLAYVVPRMDCIEGHISYDCFELLLNVFVNRIMLSVVGTAC